MTKARPEALARTTAADPVPPRVKAASTAPDNPAAFSGDAAAATAEPPTALGARLLAWLQELTQFGLVGALAFVIDSGLFNLFQHGPLGVLAGHPNTANVISACVATCFSWVANRSWTYRGRTQENTAREAFLFAFANAGGILITQFCLLFTHHILGLSGPLADNIAAYIVGFALGTAFRFLFYHYVVFTGDAASRDR